MLRGWIQGLSDKSLERWRVASILGVPSSGFILAFSGQQDWILILSQLVLGIFCGVMMLKFSGEQDRRKFEKDLQWIFGAAQREEEARQRQRAWRRADWRDIEDEETAEAPPAQEDTYIRRRPWYSVLSVPIDSSKKTTRAAFVKLVKQYHPDAIPRGDPERAREIIEAWEEAKRVRGWT